MKLRWKFFIILLVFSLLPILAIHGLYHHGIKKLGKTIFGKTQATLTEIACESLQRTAENASKILLLSKKNLEATVGVISYEAERVLAQNRPLPESIYFADDFDHDDTAPPDFFPSKRYWRKDADGQIVPASVSFSHPVVLLGPDVPLMTAQTDIARLLGLTASFRQFQLEFSNTIYWVYVSLENGVHLAYPGHGGYPQDFDPRRRPWYRRAGNDVQWTLPIVDATTGLVMLTASKKIYRPDGKFAGVVGLDTLITEVLQISDLTALWSSQMRSYMVSIKTYPDSNRTGLQILARKQYQTQAATWRGLIGLEWLESGEPEKMEQVIAGLESGRSGYVEMPYQDVDSFWAYANVDEYTNFLVIVPKMVIMSLPTETVQTVKAYTTERLHAILMHAAILVVLITIAALVFSKSTTQPILRLVQAAKRLSKGDFSVRVDVRMGDERDLMVQSFNDMVPKLADHLRIYRSLNLAREVQQSLLPKANPQVAGLDIAGMSIYCENTGGDYYDYLSFESRQADSISVIVGDVADHGIPSALLMATARAFIRQRSSQSGSIAEIVTDVNTQLSEDVESTGQFMTLFYMTIDRRNQSLRWVRAGHDPALVYDPTLDRFEELFGGGAAVGISKEWRYEENEWTGLTTGQIIFIGTDGIWEAQNQAGDVFGRDAIHDLIRKNAHADAQTILDSIITTLKNFLKDKDPEDDITLVIIKIKDLEPDARTG